MSFKALFLYQVELSTHHSTVKIGVSSQGWGYLVHLPLSHCALTDSRENYRAQSQSGQNHLPPRGREKKPDPAPPLRPQAGTSHSSHRGHSDYCQLHS